MITLSYLTLVLGFVCFTILYFLIGKKLAIATAFALLFGLYFINQQELGDLTTPDNRLYSQKWELKAVAQIGSNSFAVIAYFPETNSYKGYKFLNVNPQQRESLQQANDKVRKGIPQHGKFVDKRIVQSGVESVSSELEFEMQSRGPRKED